MQVTFSAAARVSSNARASFRPFEGGKVFIVRVKPSDAARIPADVPRPSLKTRNRDTFVRNTPVYLYVESPLGQGQGTVYRLPSARMEQRRLRVRALSELA